MKLFAFLALAALVAGAVYAFRNRLKSTPAVPGTVSAPPPATQKNPLP